MLREKVFIENLKWWSCRWRKVPSFHVKYSIHSWTRWIGLKFDQLCTEQAHVRPRRQKRLRKKLNEKTVQCTLMVLKESLAKASPNVFSKYPNTTYSILILLVFTYYTLHRSQFKSIWSISSEWFLSNEWNIWICLRSNTAILFKMWICLLSKFQQKICLFQLSFLQQNDCKWNE